MAQSEDIKPAYTLKNVERCKIGNKGCKFIKQANLTLCLLNLCTSVLNKNSTKLKGWE